MPAYRVQVYAGDVGGIDLDFEADSLGEARRIARDETPKGARPTEIYGPDDVLIEEFQAV